MSMYIGAPPPHLRKRKQRELSPVVPDPEPPTPVRDDTFGTLVRSARVYKTYAHKRARSYASEPAESGPDAGQNASSPSPRSSPTRPPVRIQYGSATRKAGVRPEDSLQMTTTEKDSEEPSAPVAELNGHHDITNAPIPSTSASPSIESQSPSSVYNVPLRTKLSAVYVEISQRRKPSHHVPGEQTSATSSVARAEPLTTAMERAGPPRGRPPKQKPIAFPSPPPTSDDNSILGGPSTRRRAISKARLSLSEALNTSFAQAVSSSPISSVAPAETVDSPPKRKPGRPRGRGRGRARAASGPTRSEVVLSSLQRMSGAEAGPSRDPAPLAQVKRGPGRPRKHPLPSTIVPVSTGSPSSRPSSTVGLPGWTPLKSPDEDEDDSEAEAVAAQLLPSTSRSARRGASPSLDEDQLLYQSVDVGPVVRALAHQAAIDAANTTAGYVQSTAPTPVKKRRGRPPGSKNKATLAREAEARRQRLTSLSSGGPRAPLPPLPLHTVSSLSALVPAPSLPPVPIKRPRGRPRKSAPSAFPPSGVMEYFEPLKDPESDAPDSEAGPSTPRPRTRSHSRHRTRRNSAPDSVVAPPLRTPAVPAPAPPAPMAPSSYYLDLGTLTWKRRSRSISVSPSKRKEKRPSAASSLWFEEQGTKATEYQTSGALYTALREALALASVTPKVARTSPKGKGKGKGKGKAVDNGLKIAPSGVLLFADLSDDSEDEEDTRPRTSVFRGSWAVLGNPHSVFDDSVPLKALHTVVREIGGSLGTQEQRFTRSADGQHATVVVPCCCASLGANPAAYPAGAREEEEDAPRCLGEMAVSVREEMVEMNFGGKVKTLRTTIVVAH
ncbi:hypothetical protein C8Q79DRAFT_988912 [Trametes meyenii]|nr:hypothetical protein C8Q79DRAFT_988912 [Trametes meyenii]